MGKEAIRFWMMGGFERTEEDIVLSYLYQVWLGLPPSSSSSTIIL